MSQNGTGRQTLFIYIYINILGYFVPPCFQHNFIDIWVSYLANVLDRFVWMSDISFEHLVKTNPIDDVVGEYTMNCINDSIICH